MFQIKNQIFLNFTKIQKNNLLSFLRSFIKKNSTLTKDEIINKFIEEETYYYEINNPHFEFVIEYLSDENFLSDLGKYIDTVFYEIEQKKALEPILKRQKEIQKELRKKANDYKMSKLKPTKKQLFYYEKVAKAHNVEMKDTTGASRLDLRNWIMEIIDQNEEK